MSANWRAVEERRRVEFNAPAAVEAERAEDVDTARLVTRAQAGDSDAFALIYSRYFERVYGYLKVVVNDRHEAEDVTQRVFMEALEALPRYTPHPGKPFRAWLFTIVRNQAIKVLRKQRRVEPWDSEALDRRRERPVSEDAALRALDWIGDADLMLFVDRLPLAQRQVLMARFLLGMNAKEIAEMLDRSPETVRMQQSRALAFLRQRLTAIGRAPTHPNLEPSVVVFRQAKVVRLRRFQLKNPGPTG
jgi:RNA polymerase sigma-70 factor (ECF subfamily)